MLTRGLIVISQEIKKKKIIVLRELPAQVSSMYVDMIKVSINLQNKSVTTPLNEGETKEFTEHEDTEWLPLKASVAFSSIKEDPELDWDYI